MLPIIFTIFLVQISLAFHCSNECTNTKICNADIQKFSDIIRYSSIYSTDKDWESAMIGLGGSYYIQKQFVRQNAHVESHFAPSFKSIQFLMHQNTDLTKLEKRCLLFNILKNGSIRDISNEIYTDGYACNETIEKINEGIKARLAVFSLPMSIQRSLPTYRCKFFNELKESVKRNHSTIKIDALTEKLELKILEQIKSKFNQEITGSESLENFWAEKSSLIYEDIARNVPDQSYTSLVELRDEYFCALEVKYLQNEEDDAFLRLIKLWLFELWLRLGNKCFIQYKPGIDLWLLANKNIGFLATENDYKDAISYSSTLLQNSKKLYTGNKLKQNIIPLLIKEEETYFAKFQRKSDNSTGYTSINTTFFCYEPENTTDCIFVLNFRNDIKFEEGIRTNFQKDLLYISSENLILVLQESNINLRTRKRIIKIAFENIDKINGTKMDTAKRLLQHERLKYYSENYHGHIFEDQGGIKMIKSNMKVSRTRFRRDLSEQVNVQQEETDSTERLTQKMLSSDLAVALEQGDIKSLLTMGGRMSTGPAYEIFNDYSSSKFDFNSDGDLFDEEEPSLHELSESVGMIPKIGDDHANLYLIADSISTLFDPNTSKFDRDDAISYIFSGTSKLLISVGVDYAVALGLPAIPVAITGLVATFLIDGIIRVFQVETYVERIHNEIPLLSYEKAHEFNEIYWGFEISNYLQDLMKTRHLNNIFVEQVVQTLEDNPNIYATIVPARSLIQKDAKCYLYKEDCSRVVIWTSCGSSSKVANCNGYHGKCDFPYSHKYCSSSRDKINDLKTFFSIGLLRDSERFHCGCGDLPPPTWGYEILDNHVDFRSKKHVYSYRAKPNIIHNSAFDFLCVPSYNKFQNDKITNINSNWGYLCEGAITVRRKNGGGEFTVYSLGKGNDVAYASNADTTRRNIFDIDSGHKNYVGGPVDDIFQLNTCQDVKGVINGNGMKFFGNTLVLPSVHCQEIIYIDLVREYFTTLHNTSSGSNLTEIDILQNIYANNTVSKKRFTNSVLTLKSIQQIYGRSGFSELVVSSCDTKMIKLNGGSIINPDVIMLPKSCDETSLTVIAEGTTLILIMENDFKGELVISAEYFRNFTVIAPMFTSGVVSINLESKNTLEYAVIYSNMIYFIFGKNEIAKIQFTEQKNESLEAFLQVAIGIDDQIGKSFLYYNLEESLLQFVFNLNETGSGKRQQVGYKKYVNVFQLINGHWNVSGGSSNDSYILKEQGQGNKFRGYLDGLEGENTLELQSSVPKRIYINVFFQKFRADSIVAYNIKNVQGKNGVPQKIEVCGSTNINLGGGNTTLQDEINVPSYCVDTPDLRVFLYGHSKFQSFTQIGKFEVAIKQLTETKLNVDVQMLVTNQTQFKILIYFPSNKLNYNEFIKQEDGFFRLRLRTIDYSNLNFTFNSGNIGIYFVGEDNKFNGQLIFDENQLDAYLLHQIHETNSVRKGAIGIKNLFRIKSTIAQLDGGKMDDVFQFEVESEIGKINGHGGVDSIVLSSNLTSTLIEIDLLKQSMHFDDYKKIELVGINAIEGRLSGAESVICNHLTTFVSLNGGKNVTNPDTILYPETPIVYEPNATFVINYFTNLINNASKGNFTYEIKSTLGVHISYKHDTESKASNFFRIHRNLNDLVKINSFNETISFVFKNEEQPLMLSLSKKAHIQVFNKHNSLTSYILITNNEITLNTFVTSSTKLTELHLPSGVNNNVVLQGSGSLKLVKGSKNNDKMFLQRDIHIHKLSGGEGINVLHVGNEYYARYNLLYDMRKSTGSISYESNTALIGTIDELDSFTSLIGRENGKNDNAFIDCNTRLVKFVPKVYISDSTCTKNSVTIIHVNELSQVLFQSAMLTAIELDSFRYNQPTFVYRFDTTSSFDITADEDSLFNIYTHIFHLNFNVSDLNEIHFEKSTESLVYTIQQLKYSHKLFPISDFDPYYINPNFITKDGFHIRISRYGGILLTLSSALPKADTSENLLKNLDYFAQHLKISIIIMDEHFFMHIGNPSTKNVLVNHNEKESLLVGHNSTTFNILDLQNDVYIYGDCNVQSNNLVDLTALIMPIRELTGTKYKPKIEQFNDDFYITIADFSAKITLVKGVLCPHKYQLIFNTVILNISSLSVNVREKRDTETRWTFLPLPINLEPGFTYTFCKEDIEDGMLLENPESNTTFSFVKDERNLVLTNLESVEYEEPITFVFVEFFDQTRNNSFNNISLILPTIDENENTTVETIEDINLDKLEYLENLLERKEKIIIGNNLEIQKQFEVTLWKKAIRQKHFKIGILAASILILIGLTILLVHIFLKLINKKTYSFQHYESQTKQKLIELKKCTTNRNV